MSVLLPWTYILARLPVLRNTQQTCLLESHLEVEGDFQLVNSTNKHLCGVHIFIQCFNEFP